MDSPRPVDDPLARFRVHCPRCRTNVWASLEEPPVNGDDILADHDCPGPATPGPEHQAALAGPPEKSPGANVQPARRPNRSRGVRVEGDGTVPSG